MSEFNESVSGVETVKKSKAPIVAGITAGVVAVAAGGSVIAYNTSAFVKNKVKLATLSPTEYYAWVNDLNSSEQIEKLSEQYGEYLEFASRNSDKGVNVKINAEYTMSDGLKTLAKNAMGGTDKANTFIDNINNVSLTLDESVFQGNIGYNLGLDFNGNDVADLEMSMDYVNMFMMGRVPQLTEKYIGMDLTSALETDEAVESGFIGDNLTQEEFRTLAEKYTSLWNDCVSEVQQEKGEEITIGDYTSKYTVLTVDMNEEFIENTAEKYISTVKEDKIIKDIVVNRLEICDEGKYFSDLDNALEEIRSDEDGEDDNLMLTLKTYIDSNGKIRGISFMDNENAGFEFIFTGESEEKANGILTFNNPNEGVEVKCDIDYVANDNKYTGSVDMSFTENKDKTNVLVEFTDLETVNEDYGYMNGNLNVSVNDSAPFAVALSSDGSSQKASFDVDIEDVNYGNVVLEFSSSEITELSIPDKSGAYIIDENANGLEGYVSEEDIINFIASIVKNIGFASTDEEAREIVNSYLYGYSSNGAINSYDVTGNYNTDDIIPESEWN